MAILEIAVEPIGESHMSESIARSLEVVEESGLDYEVTPMGTVVQGTTDELFDVARQMHRAAFDGGTNRVMTTIRLDDCPNDTASLDDRVRSVEEKMGA